MRKHKSKKFKKETVYLILLSGSSDEYEGDVIQEFSCEILLSSGVDPDALAKYSPNPVTAAISALRSFSR